MKLSAGMDAIISSFYDKTVRETTSIGIDSISRVIQVGYF